MMKKINVGISIFAVQGANIWGNGLNMNIAFLVQLFRASPNIGKIYLLNGGDLDRLPEGLEFDGLDVSLVKPHEVTYELDLVIEMGAQLPLEWLKRMSALGCKLVSFLVGHAFCGTAEMGVFDRHSGQMFNGVPWNEVWTLPQYMKSCAPMLRTLTRAPVYAMPHIWSPMFLQVKIDESAAQGHAFGFKPHENLNTPRAWRTGIFEPNISVAKNCTIAMLACEAAYRVEPQSVGLMMVMNTFGMKEHPTFNRFALCLDLTKDAKASYEPRVGFVDAMANHHLDAVVSHQWENAQNYVYYDALYGGYPLIHNSPYMRDAQMGFYYPDFDASIGGQVLVEAWKKDADYWTDYRTNATTYLNTLHPTHPSQIETFMQKIEQLVGDAS